MTGVWADGNVSAVKGLTIHNHHGKQIQQNGVKDGVNGGRHMLCEEQKSKFNEVSDDKNGAHRGLVHVQAVLHTQQQQSQPCTVRWERFLPIRSIKVLLVENDECTRHVVSALLRNCSYEVTAVANGVDAWKVLDDLTNHIDLILTEVTMPYLSGIGLLSKVMNHKTHKSVPVIMMSSNDSMGIVFKCLSKGAVDFLVKPIRKNELKNLWQHVWRKCHSSGGSGSESGIRIQKSTKAKHIEGVEDSSDGNDENASDNGSGTQGSWSKRAIEVESPQAMLQWDELAKPLDSTCAQAIHSRPEAQSSNWVPTNSAREYQGVKDEHGNASMGKDLQIGVASTPDLQINAEEVSKDEETLIGKLEELNTAQKSELRGEDTANGVLTKETGTYNNTTTKEMPSLELSLMQHREVGDSGTTVQERNILRQSGQSAFSRYGGGTTATTSANNQAPTGNVGSCSNVDNNNYSNNNNNNYNNNNSSEVAKTGSMHNSSSIPNHQSNGSSNNIHDVGSSTNKILVKPPETKIPFGKVDSVAQAALVQSRVMMQQQQVQVQHHHHHYHHHHHHMHNQQQQQQNDSLPVRGNGEGNYTSASGSNNGSNGQDESNAGVIGEETTNDNMDTEDDEMEAIWKAGGGESGSGSRSGVVDQSPQALREAALNKFRQKRKERNFGKKVRYQSRKRLAEQRPRVRGQFVSLSSSPDDNNNKGKASDSNS